MCTRLHPALSVSRLIGWLVGHFIHDFYFWTSPLLPKWCNDLKYAPAHPHANWVAVYLALLIKISICTNFGRQFLPPHIAAYQVKGAATAMINHADHLLPPEIPLECPDAGFYQIDKMFIIDNGGGCYLGQGTIRDITELRTSLRY